MLWQPPPVWFCNPITEGFYPPPPPLAEVLPDSLGLTGAVVLAPRPASYSLLWGSMGSPRPSWLGPASCEIPPRTLCEWSKTT